MGHLRGWLVAAALGVGIGAALAVGCGTAAADTGSSSTSASSSHSASSNPSKAATPKRATAQQTAVVAADVRASKTVGALAVSPAKLAPAPKAARTSARSATMLPAPTPAQATAAAGSSSSGVTGVKVGHSNLDIPVGSSVYTGAADWYFPTQADGSVQAQGVIYLQHGFLGDKSWYSALATQEAQQTNSIVVVPNIPSFPFFTCSGCTLNSVQMAQGVAALFIDPSRSALNISANAAGYEGVLPEQFVLTGHSAGGGLAAAAGGFYAGAVAPADNKLLGVVMYDGVSSNGTFAPALQALGDIPVYQIAAPPQPWNAYGQTTNDLVALRPGQFVGDVLANGSHVDSLIGGVPIIDAISQLLIRPSPPGNTAAVYTLATGWINDLYAGRGPSDPLYGIYGEPDQYIVMGPTAAVVLGPSPVVDVNQYLGTWYEVGSVKQFFSIGLVNTTAVYSLNPDGSIKVENSGNYFFNNGPESTIVGTALPVDASNNKLNVTFFGSPSDAPPGNYWIVDVAPDYSWAIVTDSTGCSGFLLSRTPTVSADLYQQLLNRASVKGVNGWITPTRQPQAAVAAAVASARAGLAA
ncbi:lipocalin family protein [Mycolicibacterium komossense]|uniref:Lipocalin family protein n=1 Tax=Mycolicibacterium komossense TaxID=1779 RepID=A0ABT3CE38_9MYCO|nr:lipocalin family protein [Mycolicibacterium komossense]MCV7227491.1 lipocalin family protein [Mycolicibacterium komossense]